MNKILKAINSFFGGDVVKDLIDLIPTKEKKREFELKLRESMFEFLQLEYKDLESARAMQVEALKQNDLFAKRFLYYLTIVLLGVTLLVTILPFFVSYPPENEALINRGTDFLYIVSGARIIAFFFGNKNPNSSR